MIAYITLGTNDIDRAGKFYDGLLGELGAGRVMENERLTACATRLRSCPRQICMPILTP